MRPRLSRSFPAFPRSADASLADRAFLSGAEAAQVAGAPVVDRVRGGQGTPDPKSNGYIPAAMPVGRRSAPRLRLSLPAQLMSWTALHPAG